MKKILTFSVISFLISYGYSQQLPFMDNFDHYINNLEMFGEGQEDGRTYHIPNNAISLNGTWKFLYGENPYQIPKTFYHTSFVDNKWDNINVPSNWEMEGFGQPIFRNISVAFPLHNKDSKSTSLFSVSVPNVPMDYNPTGAYRKTFYVPEDWEGTEIFLRFEKVASASCFWVNGKQIGYNEGAFEPVEFNITKHLKYGKDNTISVLVIKYSDGYYLEGQDFWRLAGIFDDVWLYSSPKTHIWDWQIITDFDSKYENSSLNINVDIRNYRQNNNDKYSVLVKILDNDNVISQLKSKKISFTDNDKQTVKLNSTIISPKKWSAEEPNLYGLEMSLLDGKGEIIETIKKNIGFKKTEIKDGTFYLNGQPIKVFAQCSHMQHPTKGHTIDEETIRKDFEILKQFNFNAVRTSHYPPTSKYVELADEYGLYIIDETGDESHDTEYVSSDSAFIPMYRERVRQMVLRDRNHPSVLFWSAGNESGNGFCISEVVKEGKKYDPTRYFMYGGNSETHEAEDIIGPRYPTPIRHEIDYAINRLDTRPSFMDEYISVAGNGCGGLDDYWREIYSHKSLIGGALWDFVSPGLMEKVRLLEDKSPYHTQVGIMGRARIVPGLAGNGIDFNKTDQWVQIYRSNITEITSDKLTIAFDIYPRKYNGSCGYLISKGSNQFGIQQVNNDKLRFYIYTESNKRTDLEVDLPKDWENNWHNIIATYNGDSMKLHVDKKLCGSINATGRIKNFPLAITIGNNEELNLQNMRNYLSDAIYDNVAIFTEVTNPEDSNFKAENSVLWLDFEEEIPTSDTFYSYGLGARTYGSIWPNRIPQPEMWQMKKSQQPIIFNVIDKEQGLISINNKHFFTNTTKYDIKWSLTADNDTIQKGTLEKINIMPNSCLVTTIPFKKPSKIEPGKDYRININAYTKQDYIWAKAGHEVAWEQYDLDDWFIPVKPKENVIPPISLSQENGKINISGKGFSYIFDSLTGHLESMTINGEKVLRSPIVTNLWRAPLANESDNWCSRTISGSNYVSGYGTHGTNQAISSMYYSYGLDSLKFIPTKVEIVQTDNKVYIISREIALFKSHSAIENLFTYTIDGNGEININHNLIPQCQEVPLWFPRIGLTMELDGEMTNVSWNGRGPQSSYPDRKSGYRKGIYQSTVDDMYEPYLLPQDYGERIDTKWVVLKSKSGVGLEFSMDKTFGFNAYPFTTENLTKSLYQYQLQKADIITLNLDYAVSGVGSTDNGIFYQYRVYPTPHDRTIKIKPIYQ